MGREIRRVPRNWKHPTIADAMNSKGTDNEQYYYRIANKPWAHDTSVQSDYISLFDKDYEEACKEWIREFIEWHGEGGKPLSTCSKYYWEYAGNPPDAGYYRNYKGEETTWYQVYETISEGTPVSPAFATHEELIEYLVNNGDFWDQSRGENTYSNKENTTRFVTEEMSVPTMIVNASTGQIKMGVESLEQQPTTEGSA